MLVYPLSTWWLTMQSNYSFRCKPLFNLIWLQFDFSLFNLDWEEILLMVLPPGLPSANNIINNATTTASAAIWTLDLKFWISSFEFEFSISIWHSKTKFCVEFWILNLLLLNVFYPLYLCIRHTLRSIQKFATVLC